MSWLCHRKCIHCYEDRFRPYYGEELTAVVSEAEASFRPIIANLPPRMSYLDASDGLKEKRGRIILAGGEILLEPVRQTVLYPALELLYEKYRDQGGVELIIQTTGDILTQKIVEELAERHINVISISGIDEFHKGLEEEADQEALRTKVRAMCEACGFQYAPLNAAQRPFSEGPFFHFFGATKGSWIGKIWPRGRAHDNDLSTATLADNFCNAWSGGLNFLDTAHGGSEVSIEPNGNVYPCCMKTQKAIGNLRTDTLDSILSNLKGNPVYEAISMGHPERMGITHGWSVKRFYEESTMKLPSGASYQNLCIGCDRFHEKVLGNGSALVSLLPVNPR